ncbi:ABC transporter permease [Candidatus Woesearchaeota archaeon]|nr:ABC transporter permease [Candidatus Woesearchaeota archaeon]
MFEIFTIIKKDFLRIIRSKGSSLIIIFGPLIIMLLGGLAFTSSGLYGINVGLYEGEESTLNDVIEAKVIEKKFDFTLENSLENCKSNVKNGITNICVEIVKREGAPELLEQKFGNKVIFYLDYSNVRLVWAITGIIRSVVTEESNRISRGIINKGVKNADVYVNYLEQNKEKLSNIKRQEEDLKSKITTTISSIEQIETDINKIVNSDLANINNEITNVKENLDSFNTSARQVITSLKAMGGGPQQQAIILEQHFNNFYSSSTNSLTLSQNEISNVQILLNSKDAGLATIKNDLNFVLGLINSNIVNIDQIQSVLDDADKNLQDFRNFNPDILLQPIPVEYKPVSEDVGEAGSISSSVTYLDYLLPSLLILVIMFVGVLLSSTLIVKEKNLPVYFRNLISPTNDVTFAVSIFISSLLLVLFQTSILLLIASLVFKISIIERFFEIIVLLTLISSIFVLFGMLIGYIFKSEETSTIAGVSMIILFLLFSSVILPIETLPVFIGKVTQFSPFVVSELALRKIMIFNSVFGELLLLFISIIILFSLVIAGQVIGRIRHD